MNKKIIFLLFFCFTLTLTGCKNQVEIEDRDFVQTLMVGMEKNQFKLYYGLPDLSASTGQSVPEAEKEMKNYTADSILQIEEKYNLNSEKRLDYSHLKTIILDSALSANQEKMEEFFSYVQNNYEISRNTPVFITDEDLEDLAKINGKVVGGLGANLENLYKNTRGRNRNAITTIGNCITAYTSKNQVLLIPSVSIHEESTMLAGAIVLQENMQKKKLSEETYLLLLLAQGKGEDNLFFPYQENAVLLEEVAATISFDLEQEKPHAFVSITGKMNQVETPSLNEERLNNWVKTQVEKALNSCYQNSLDVLNLYRQSTLKKRELWLGYQENLSSFLNDLSLFVVCDFKIYAMKQDTPFSDTP